MRSLLLALLFPFAANAASLLSINPGNRANDGLGDDLRTSQLIINSNFAAIAAGTLGVSDPGSARGNIKASTHVDTIAALRALSGTSRTNLVEALGYYTKGDGGGGTYFWHNTSTDDEDGGFVIAATGVETGRWVAVDQSVWNAKRFGARMDGSSNDDAVLQTICDAAPSGAPIFIPRGTLTFKALPVSGTKTVWFVGTGVDSILFHRADSTNSLVTTGTDTDAQSLVFENLTFDGNKANRTSAANDQIDYCSLVAARHHNKRLFFRNVTFKNFIRSAIRNAGQLVVDSCTFESPAEHNGTSLPHCIFGQPTGYAEDMTVSVVNSTFKATSRTAADRYKQAAGIFLTEQDGGTTSTTNKFRELLVSGNRFYGIGGNRNLQPSAPVDTYNGVSKVIITDNYVTGAAYSAFKLTRADDGIVANNVIEDCQTPGSFDDVTFAILWEPTAREGTSYFVDTRAGEKHYNFKCVNNIIRNSTRTAIYCVGPNSLIQGNTIHSIQESDLGDNLPLVMWNAHNSDVLNNTLIDIPENGIWMVTSTNVNVIGNRSFPLTVETGNTLLAATGCNYLNVSDNQMIGGTNTPTAASGLWFSGCSDLDLNNNTVAGVAVGYVFLGSTNINLRFNRQPNCTDPISFDTATAATGTLRLTDNDWQQWQYRMDRNGNSYISVQNLHTNTLANPMVEVLARGAGGTFGVRPTNFANATAAGRVQIEPTTSALGADVSMHSGQVFRVRKDSTMLLQSAEGATSIYGGFPTALTVDTSNDNTYNYIVVRKGGTNVTQFGWQSGTGFNVTSADGTANNLSVSEQGSLTVRSNAVVNGTLILKDGTSKEVSFGASDSGGTGFKLLRIAN